MSKSKVTIHDVWQDKTEELVQEILDFWKVHRAIPSNVDINKRAQQVVLVLRDENQEIIGITTSYVTKYTILKNNVFVFRGMLAPSHRIPGLFIKMTITTIQILEASSRALNDKERPIGVIAELENPALKKARITKTPSGMHLIGFSQRENPIYAYYFQGARF